MTRKFFASFLGIILMILFLISCASSKWTVKDFPVDGKGYPKYNYVKINDRIHELNRIKPQNEGNGETIRETLRITVPAGEDIVVYLPDDTDITWITPQKVSGLKFYEEERVPASEDISLEVKDKSPYLQRFTFKITNKDLVEELVFRRVHVSELEKDTELLPDYVLTITLEVEEKK